MPSQGPNNGSSFTNVGTGVSWSGPGYAQYSDNTRASVILYQYDVSSFLQATGFSFNIPSDATISGIVVEIERSASASNAIRDTGLYLVKFGAAVGNNKADTVSYWPTSDTYKTYGSSTDLWGTTWAPSEINSSDFGVRIAVTNVLYPSSSALIDHIRITVHYTFPTTHAMSSQII